MIPPNIVQTAVTRGLDVIGITDHNSAENVLSVRAAARDTGITVIGGMEVTTAEEVHVLALFDADADLEAFQRIIYGNLHGSNDPGVFGHQWVVDEDGGVVDVNPRLLIGATTMPIDEAVAVIHDHAGIAIAAHVDRATFSVVSQLGFRPPDLDLDAVELSPFAATNGFGADELAAAGCASLPVVRFSDAHHIDDIGRSTTDLLVAAETVSEFRLALRGAEGRAVIRT